MSATDTLTPPEPILIKTYPPLEFETKNDFKVWVKELENTIEEIFASVPDRHGGNENIKNAIQLKTIYQEFFQQLNATFSPSFFPFSKIKTLSDYYNRIYINFFYQGLVLPPCLEFTYAKNAHNTQKVHPTASSTLSPAALLLTQCFVAKQTSTDNAALKERLLEARDELEDYKTEFVRFMQNTYSELDVSKKRIDAFTDEYIEKQAMEAPAKFLKRLEKSYFYNALVFFVMALLTMLLWAGGFFIFIMPILQEQHDTISYIQVLIPSGIFSILLMTIIALTLRLAIIRVNLSVDAKERTIMALAYQSMLAGKVALNDEKQMLFLNAIVTRSQKGHVKSDDVRLPIEMIYKIAQNAIDARMSRSQETNDKQ